MQGNPQVLDALNRALTIELTAINQYFCQAKMCQNWGFWKLGNKHYEESMGEMKHADRLIERILFLEGIPEIARYDVIRVGANVKEQFENDLKLELSGVKHYNETIDLCIKLKDNGNTRFSGRSSPNQKNTSTGWRRSSASSRRSACRTISPNNWVTAPTRTNRDAAADTP